MVHGETPHPLITWAVCIFLGGKRLERVDPCLLSNSFLCVIVLKEKTVASSLHLSLSIQRTKCPHSRVKAKAQTRMHAALCT